MKKIIFYLFTALTIFSCKSDDSDSNSNSNKNYLKSYFNDTGSPDSFYEYDNGFLTKIFFFNIVTTYKYDNKGRLQLKTYGNQTYSYEYDNQNRLIKEIKNGTSDYITLSYSTSKVIATEHSSSNSTNLVSEIFIDNLGRIIKTVQMTPTYSNQYLIQEFTYDINGNIINRLYSGSVSNEPDLSINFQFDNKINPYYISYKNLYNSIYYLESRKEFSYESINPNNIISVETTTATSTRNITYNIDNLPTKMINSTIQNGSSQQTTATAFYEYY
jgi:YD repeat-containing protein